jgi:AraC family transcriptional regulator, positive regulator of tynA and feaB
MVTSVPSDAAGARAPAPLKKIREVMRHNLSDPDLDCARIAAEVGLSVRQVHAVFSTSGKTLMRHIWEERLDRIAAELANPAIAYKPVSAIAFDWGFNEAAHFSRQFRARFGMPPSKYREQQLASVAVPVPQRLQN